MAHSKNHRQNHNFQILHFLVGACHTADAAYALLCDLREEREMACKQYQVSQIRSEAKALEAKELTTSTIAVDRLEGKAQLLELENDTATGKVLYAAAQDELAFLDECLEKIEPVRKYKHLSDAESHEMCQREEWKLELIERAENYLATGGIIPADHFATMRTHPDFKDEILPRIQEMQNLLLTPAGRIAFTMRVSSAKGFLGE